MKTQDKAKLHNANPEELQSKLVEAQAQLAHARIDQNMKQQKDRKIVRKLQKDIAVIKTILHQKTTLSK